MFSLALAIRNKKHPKYLFLLIMNLRVIVIGVVFGFASVEIVTPADGGNHIYLKGVRCNFSEKILHKNLTCFAKSYSRSFSGLNIKAFAQKPLYNLNVSFLRKKLLQVQIFKLNKFRLS